MNLRRIWRTYGLFNWDTQFVCVVILLTVGMPQAEPLTPNCSLFEDRKTCLKKGGPDREKNPEHYITSLLGREQRDLRRLDDFEDNEISMVDACASHHNFEILTSAVNDQLELVEVAPDTWVYVTRCRHVARKCLGVGETIYSVCRPKKSWIQVYGRTKNGPWQPQWVAVDTSCACAVEKQNGYIKTSDKLGYPLYIL